jgi:hypothetical protein
VGEHEAAGDGELERELILEPGVQRCEARLLLGGERLSKARLRV